MSANWSLRLANAVSKWTPGPRDQEDGGYYRPAQPFSELSAYKSILHHRRIAERHGIETPFFRTHEGHRGTHTFIAGKEYLNYAWCDYLGLNSHDAVAAASKNAIDGFGTCVSASRMVAGQIPLHLTLETEIADFIGVDGSLLFVSGHAANVSTIGTIMGEDDLIVYDEFVHNSAVVGSRLSRATSRSFHHNDCDALSKILNECRAAHRNALIIIEGLYSTEGDVPDLKRFVELKRRYGCWLMVDDAHGVGVLGATGRGSSEYAGVDPRDVDIWMGTLSKTLASCGGYIAGSKSLIEVLRYAAPGFVFSVGLPPPMTAAALAALRVLKSEPARVASLKANSVLFHSEARSVGFDTGNSIGLGMVPIIVGATTKTAKMAQRLYEQGIIASVIIYPGVPVGAGRLRFFITSEHTYEQIWTTVRTISQELTRW